MDQQNDKLPEYVTHSIDWDDRETEGSDDAEQLEQEGPRPIDPEEAAAAEMDVPESEPPVVHVSEDAPEVAEVDVSDDPPPDRSQALRAERKRRQDRRIEIRQAQKTGDTEKAESLKTQEQGLRDLSRRAVSDRPIEPAEEDYRDDVTPFSNGTIGFTLSDGAPKEDAPQAEASSDRKPRQDQQAVDMDALREIARTPMGSDPFEDGGRAGGAGVDPFGGSDSATALLKEIRDLLKEFVQASAETKATYD